MKLLGFQTISHKSIKSDVHYDNICPLVIERGSDQVLKFVIEVMNRI